MVYFDPVNTEYKSKIGAVKEKTDIIFRIKYDGESSDFIIQKDGEDEKVYPMTFKDGFFEIKLNFEVGLYWYCFSLRNGKFIGKNSLNFGEIYSDKRFFQLSVYSSDYAVPSWLKGGIIYQIFPDRFYSFNQNVQIENGKFLHEKWGDLPVYNPNENGEVLNNDFFGGNIKGITQKLPFLSSLGVTAIYLNPIFKAYSNHRYDTGDYNTIDPLLGDELDFENLIEKADLYGIKIILDGDFNHTGSDSIYFNKNGSYNSYGAFNGKDSPYRKWYKFTDDNGNYESWWGIKTLPALNKECEEYVDFICGENGVLNKYTKKGIGGWRLDVVDELPEKFVNRIRTAVKKVNENAIIIGEVWEDASNKISYGKRRKYFLGNELDSVMNYPLKDAIIDFVLNNNFIRLSSIIREQIDHYPEFVLNSLMNMLSTHDTFRILSVLNGKNVFGLSKGESEKVTYDDFESFFKNLKIATLLQFTLYGVPSVFYGDEAGLEGYFDPLNRKCYPWGNENKEILNWYKFLGDLRKDKVFIDGKFKEIYCNEGTYIYSRLSDCSEIGVAINNGETPISLDFSSKVYDVYDEKTVGKNVKIEGKSFLIYKPL